MFLCKKPALLGKLFAAALALCLAAGCGGTDAAITPNSPATEETGEPAAAQPEAEEGSPGASPSLRMLQGYGGWLEGGFGPDGLYVVSPFSRPDGSFNILYVDYASAQVVYLCSQPNCTHDTDSCTSYVPLSPGGVLPEVVGDKLILFHPGTYSIEEGESLRRPYVWTANLDGSDGREVLTFAANQRAEHPMLTDGTSIYCRLTTTEGDSETAELIRINPVAGSRETLAPLDVNHNEWLWGGYGENIVLYRYAKGMDEISSSETSWPMELVALNVATGERTTLFTWEGASPSLYGSILIYTSPEDSYFHLKDLSTQAEYTLTQYEIPTDETLDVAVIDCVDNHLLIRQRTHQSNTPIVTDVVYYLLDFEGGISEWNLTYDEDGLPRAMTVITAVDETHYLIVENMSFEATKIALEDGSSDVIPSPVKTYAIISKENYWNSVDDMTIIQPLS